jgi:hypothetical protein
MGAVAFNAEQSVVIRADTGTVWQLLLNPAIWSLRATVFMFAVPGADQLLYWIGSTSTGLPSSGLYELAVDDTAGSVTFQAPPPSRQYTRLTVQAVRRGVKLRAQTTGSVPRIRAANAELAAYAGLHRWLRRIGAVAEGHRPPPDDAISASVVDLCLRVPPPAADWVSVTEAAVIRGDPRAVWAAVHAPHFDSAPGSIPVACGFVPGAPVGRPGELQYGVVRGEDGSLRSSAVATSQVLDGLGVVTHRVRPPYDQTRYRVSAEGDQARLELTWTGPAVGSVAAVVAGWLRATLERHKSELESPAGDQG